MLSFLQECENRFLAQNFNYNEFIFSNNMCSKLRAFLANIKILKNTLTDPIMLYGLGTYKILLRYLSYK